MAQRAAMLPLAGQYRHPLRAIAFNAAERWMRDVTAEIAREVLSCAVETDVASPVREFLARACR
jgi:hypothetical protein